MSFPARLCFFLLASWGITLISVANSQPEYRIVQQWSAADGLPADTVSGMTIDRQSNLWLATYDGVVRYQGFDFRTYTRENEPDFPNNRAARVMTAPADGVIIHFENDELGHLGKAGYQAFGQAERDTVVVWRDRVWFIDARTLQLRAWSPHSSLALHGEHPLNTIAVDEFNDRLLLGGHDGQLFAVTTDKDNQIDWITLAGATSYPVLGLAAGPDGEVLVLDTRGARELRPVPAAPADQSVERWIDPSISHHSAPRDSMQLVVWTQTQPHRLRAAWTHDAWLVANLATGKGQGPHHLRPDEMQALPLEDATSVDADRSPAGVVQIDSAGQRWVNNGHRLFRDGEPVFQSGLRIDDFLVDPNEQIWIARPGQGLALVKRSVVQALGNGPGELPDPNISLVTELDSRILTGSWVALSSYDRDSGRWTQLLDRAARDVLPDGDGLLVGTYGLCKMIKAGRCEPVPDFPAPNAEVLQLHRDATGALWAGTGSGLFHRTPEGRWQPEPIHPATARVALEQSGGRLLLGTNGAGLLVVSIHATPAFAVTELGAEHGLTSPFIRSLLEVSDGRILVGTEDAGICLLASDLGVIGCLSTSGGLPHHSVHYMVTDRHNRLWVNTNAGIYRVDLADLLSHIAGSQQQPPAFARFGLRQGLLSIEGNGGVYRAGTKTSDGRVWFPNQRGLLAIDTSRPEPDLPGLPAPEVRVQSRTVTGPLQLDATARELDIELVTTALMRPEDVEFRYRFQSAPSWNNLGNRRRLTLTNLPPGPQSLEFQARYPDHAWNNPTARLDLNVGYLTHEHPLTHAFLGILGIAGFATLWIAVRRRQLKLAGMVEKRSQQLDQASAQVSQLNDSIQKVDLEHRVALRAVSHELKRVLDAAIEPLLHPSVSTSTAQDLSALQAKAKTLKSLIQQVNTFSDMQEPRSSAAQDQGADPKTDQEPSSVPDIDPENDIAEDLAHKVRVEILLHLGDPDFSVEHLARRLGMSRSVLYRRVSEFSRLRPAELIRDMRLEQAGQLLLESEERVSTIGHAVGFRDAATFSRAFSKKMGVSPRQWRQQQAGKPQGVKA